MININSSINDLKLALKLFLITIAILILTSVVGLSSWPWQGWIVAILSGDSAHQLAFFVGYAPLIILIFAGSRPLKSHLWALLIVSPITMALLYNLNGTIEGNILKLLQISIAIPALLLLILRISGIHGLTNDQGFEKQLQLLVVLSLMFFGVPLAFLQLTITLHPLTYDLFALHWDALLGFNLTHELLQLCRTIAGLKHLAEICYNYTPLAFLAVALLHLRKRPNGVASAVLTWVILTGCAFIAYHFFPITGPKYVFGSEAFADMVASPYKLALGMTETVIAPRNGMPSMHFGWMLASTILWWRSGTTWWTRSILIAMTFFTAVGTIALGEHYVVDLIVAAPFVLAAIALSTTDIAWTHGPRKYTVIAGFGCWFLWTLMLKHLVAWTQNHTWFAFFTLFLTIVVVALQWRWMSSFAGATNQQSQVAIGSSPAENLPGGTKPQNKEERTIAFMFFTSGAAALIYQVLFAKKLALVFGSTSTATLTVLATFLGGMAIGSLIGGRLAQKTNHPVRLYALIEGGIAAYCILTPFLFDLVQSFYVHLATGSAADAPILLALRVALGAFVLLVPTILMGVTLPLLAKVLDAPETRLGSKVGLLYFVNTAGAACGALLTSYMIIPLIGVGRTTLLAALLNLLVALAAFELNKRIGGLSAQDKHAEPTAFTPLPKHLIVAALLSLGIGGILSLGLEVIYVHMLSIVAGNSVYAFGLMLATFLLGLAAGGEAARRIIDAAKFDIRSLLAHAFVGLSISIALSLWFWNGIPEYFASFANSPFVKTFVSREVIRGGICAIIMFPPTFFIGAAYVLGMDLLTGADKSQAVRRLGMGAAINTLGNIIGILLFGFVILPYIGGFDGSKLLAIAALSLALLVFVMTKTIPRKMDMIAFTGAALCVGGSFFAKLDYSTLSTGANVYFYAQRWGESIDHAESIDGGLTSVAQAPGNAFKTLLTNGKFQGNNAWHGEMQAQIGLAFLPLLHQEKRGKALVIGYGTGVTSRVMHDAGFSHLDIAELSNDVITLANKHFYEVNNKVTEREGVKLHVTDGRNLLLLTPENQPYDLISIEISSIWFAGAASLYNHEFYKLIKSRLTKDGVLQQWVQLHRLAPTDILSIISTLREEFTYVNLYLVGGQGILIASNDPQRDRPRKEAIRLLESTVGLNTIKSNFQSEIRDLPSEVLLNSKQIDAYIERVGFVRSIWISTDDNLMLEYNTPKANVNNPKASTEINLAILRGIPLQSLRPPNQHATTP